MNTIIEEIRKRIKAAENNIDAAGDYDEYADGRGVGLAAALRIIDEVEKEHPVPADVQEAARAYSASVSNGRHFRDLETGYAAGMLAERERLASCPTIKGWVARDGHGSLVFSNEKPSRLEWCGWKLWKISRDTPAVVLPNSLFPSLRWEDEPKPVRVIIEEIKQ